jgi:hypothetical protein
VRSEEENDFVTAMMRNTSNADHRHWGAWIGLHEGQGQGNWVWTSTCLSDFTAWRDGVQPKDECVSEDCALLSPRTWGEKWVDAACEVEAVCLCEHGAVVAPEYTQEIISALREGGGAEDYVTCKEESKDARAAQRQVHGWMTFQTILLLMILGTNVAVLRGVFVTWQRQATWNQPVHTDHQLGSFSSPLMDDEA